MFAFVVLYLNFPFRDPAYDTHTKMDVDVSIISKIIIEWYRDKNHYSLQDIVS